MSVIDAVLTWDDPVRFSFEHNRLQNSGHYLMETKSRGANIHWAVKHGELSDEVQEVWPTLVQGSEFYRKLFSAVTI